MKLSIWSSFFYILSPEDMVTEFDKLGYRYSELSDAHSMMLLERGDDPTAIGTAFKAHADAHNFNFLQGHLSLKAPICEKEGMELVKRQLDLFKAIGVRYAVLHLDLLRRYPELTLEQKREKNLEALKELIDHIKDTDIVLCLENLKEPKLAESAEQLLWFIEQLGDAHLGICLDTGHLNLAENKDQVHFIRTAGSRLKAFHLADNDGSSDQHLMPTARGQVDFEGIFKTCKEIGYPGLYSYEIPGESWNTPLPVLAAKTRYIRELSEYFWDIA